jgi:hypothetical protein
MASPGAPGAGIGSVAARGALGSVAAPLGLMGGSGAICLRGSAAMAWPVASLFAARPETERSPENISSANRILRIARSQECPSLPRARCRQADLARRPEVRIQSRAVSLSDPRPAAKLRSELALCGQIDSLGGPRSLLSANRATPASWARPTDL